LESPPWRNPVQNSPLADNHATPPHRTFPSLDRSLMHRCFRIGSSDDLRFYSTSPTGRCLNYPTTPAEDSYIKGFLASRCSTPLSRRSRFLTRLHRRSSGIAQKLSNLTEITNSCSVSHPLNWPNYLVDKGLQIGATIATEATRLSITLKICGISSEERRVWKARRHANPSIADDFYRFG